jgi:hypothetical protein
MNADVTITISTTGGGAVETRGPVPELAAAAGESQAGRVSGPVPLPLDELPTGATGESGGGAAGTGGPPIPTPIETLATGAAGTGGEAPMPMELGQLTTATAGLPTPEDVEASAAASKRRATTRTRSRKASAR